MQEHKLRLILANNDTNKRDPRVRQSTLVPYPNYDILISVLNPKPSSQNVKWDVRQASETYIAPFLRRINMLSKFTIKSQWIYQVPFEFPSKQVIYLVNKTATTPVVKFFLQIVCLCLIRYKIIRHWVAIMRCPRSIFHTLLRQSNESWAIQFRTIRVYT